MSPFVESRFGEIGNTFLSSPNPNGNVRRHSFSYVTNGHSELLEQRPLLSLQSPCQMSMDEESASDPGCFDACDWETASNSSEVKWADLSKQEIQMPHDSDPACFDACAWETASNSSGVNWADLSEQEYQMPHDACVWNGDARRRVLSLDAAVGSVGQNVAQPSLIGAPFAEPPAWFTSPIAICEDGPYAIPTVSGASSPSSITSQLPTLPSCPPRQGLPRLLGNHARCAADSEPGTKGVLPRVDSVHAWEVVPHASVFIDFGGGRSSHVVPRKHGSVEKVSQNNIEVTSAAPNHDVMPSGFCGECRPASSATRAKPNPTCTGVEKRGTTDLMKLFGSTGSSALARALQIAEESP